MNISYRIEKVMRNKRQNHILAKVYVWFFESFRATFQLVRTRKGGLFLAPPAVGYTYCGRSNWVPYFKFKDPAIREKLEQEAIAIYEKMVEEGKASRVRAFTPKKERVRLLLAEAAQHVDAIEAGRRVAESLTEIAGDQSATHDERVHAGRVLCRVMDLRMKEFGT